MNPITVADLITQLEELQQDTPLFIWLGGDYGVYPVTGVELSDPPFIEGGDTITLTLI